LNIDNKTCASEFDNAVDFSILYEDDGYYQITVPYDQLQASALYHLTLISCMVNGIPVDEEDDEGAIETINAGKLLEKDNQNQQF
jgi:hypothetical protein